MDNRKEHVTCQPKNTQIENIQSEPNVTCAEDNVNDVYKYLPTTIQLGDITLHVLVTSRWTEWTSDSSVNCYQLQPLDVSVSLQLFQRTFGETCIESKKEELVNLANMLGCLPLALQVAASCICKRTRQNSDLRTVLIAYIQQLVEEARRLLNDPLTEYDNRSVYASMLLTLEQLENKTDDASKLALTLINTAAYMNPDVINKKCLLAKILNEGSNAYILDEALIILTEFSLFNQRIDWTNDDDKCYSMHRIIQTSIRRNQTANLYYSVTLTFTFAGGYIFKNLVFANEPASAVTDYYKDNPAPLLLKYLTACKAIKAIFKITNGNQIVSLINQLDLLYFAVWCHDLKMIQLLYDNGCDINKLMCVETPLHCTLWNKNMEMAKWLIQAGAAVSTRQGNGLIPSSEKIKKNIRFKKTARVLIINGLFLDTKDKKGKTPLDTVQPEFKDILLQVVDECNNQLMVQPATRQRTE